jgi:Domain of unknown function (DUF4397)
MSRLPIVRYAIAAAVALAAVFVSVPAASAAPATKATVAYVRGAHFSPDTAAVDVYLSSFSGGSSTLWLSSVSYGDVSPYRAIAPGVYAVSMRPHGAAASTAPVLTWTVNITAGSSYTAAAIGTGGQLHGIVLPDTFSAPGPSTGLVRVIQASSQAGHVSARTQSGEVLTTDTGYGGASSYVSAPTGAWTVDVQSSTAPALTGQLGVSIAKDSATSVVVLDKAGGGLVVRSVLDAAGASTIPVGSVSAGGGGTAVHPGSSSVPYALLSWVCAAAAVALGGVGLLRRRRVAAPRL